MTDASRAVIPVLVFHSIADTAEPGSERWTVAPERLLQVADRVRAAGGTTLTIAEVAACLRGERPLPPRPTALTFDDGYADNRPAVEALLERDIRSTVFVTTGSIGAARRLTTSDLRALAACEGIELGAHSVSHRYLDELKPQELDRETTDSRRALGDVIGSPVASFAYPYGAYDAAVRASVARAGFTAAVAVKNALSHVHDDPLAIARWIVTADASIDRVERVLDGDAIPLAWRRERLRTRAYRAARRTRRRLRESTTP